MSVDKLDFEYIRQSKKGFTTYLNGVIQNIKNPVILGIYIFMDSLPPEWRINRQHLMKHFSIGRDKLDNCLKWMSDNKLIDYVRERRSDGTLGPVVIAVRDGTQFLEKIENNQRFGSTILKTSEPVPHTTPLKTSSVDSTTPLKNHGVDKPRSGKSDTIEETIHSFKKETKEKRDSPVDKPFVPSSRLTDLTNYQPAPTAIKASSLLEEFKKAHNQ
jgi:hypothetical protein